MEFDLLVRNGLLFEGSLKPPFKGDVGVIGDRIEDVGDLRAATGRKEIDAAGKAVAPGFIDTHTHSDLAWSLTSENVTIAAGAALQGVTTEICGNCGFSTFPHLPAHHGDLERHMTVLFGGITLDWSDLAGFAETVNKVGIHANLAPLVGHGSVRVGVLGFENRPPQDTELQAMKRLVEEAFEQGAFGLSSGLIYMPGVYAGTEELIELSRTVSRYGRPYISHIRGETDMVADSVREAIRIGREGGVPTHISHHKAAGRQNWGRTAETLGIIEQARASGSDVTVDVYPYTAGSTLLYAMLPPWAQAGGVPSMTERLKDGVSRDRIRKDLSEPSSGWENIARAAGWDGIVISTCPGKPEVEGHSVAELAKEAGKDSADYVFDLLIEIEGRATMILHMMDEVDVRRVLAYEGAMIGSDGIPLPGKPHPRWAGSFSRVVGRYRREHHLFDLPTAIWKMTGLPAQRFGLDDRGRLERHKAADLVVFDPDSVNDQATFEEPLLPPTGVGAVIVNGVIVARDGQLTGQRPGRVLTAR
jgi:N-acyl-D-amino-acid deacylase